MLWPLPGQAQPSPSHFRIRLLEQHAPTAVEVWGEGTALTLYGAAGRPLARLAPGEAALVRRTATNVVVELATGHLTEREVMLAPESGLLALDVKEGKPLTRPRLYPGALQARPAPDGALLLVNHVDVEAYVAGVVAREYGFEDVEGAKAMAVLARTYALRTAGRFGEGYDLVDHVLAQAYDGATRLTEAALIAAEATRGEVLTYDGALVEALYYASSGGHTASNEDVWLGGKPLPYLRGRPDPHEGAVSPHARWQSSLEAAALHRALGARFGTAVTGFEVAERSAEGRARRIALLGPRGQRKVVSANDFRAAVSSAFGAQALRSTFFEVRRAGGRYRFEGRGFGHGVGLSQYGALALSQQGYGYREILRYYFAGTQLAQRDAPASPVRPAALRTEPEGSPSRADRAERRVGWERQ